MRTTTFLLVVLFSGSVNATVISYDNLHVDSNFSLTRENSEDVVHLVNLILTEPQQIDSLSFLSDEFTKTWESPDYVFDYDIGTKLSFVFTYIFADEYTVKIKTNAPTDIMSLQIVEGNYYPLVPEPPAIALLFPVILFLTRRNAGFLFYPFVLTYLTPQIIA